eukprot:262621-Chlamydomonas_euryale.AAC.10
MTRCAACAAAAATAAVLRRCPGLQSPRPKHPSWEPRDVTSCSTGQRLRRARLARGQRRTAVGHTRGRVRWKVAGRVAATQTPTLTHARKRQRAGVVQTTRSLGLWLRVGSRPRQGPSRLLNSRAGRLCKRSRRACEGLPLVSDGVSMTERAPLRPT